MTDKRTFFLVSDRVRRNAESAVKSAQDGDMVTVSKATRSSAQNRHFHALCGDIAKSGLQWAGKRRSADEWKVLLVSGHAIATNQPADVIPGLEGEYINVRESTARMGVKRAASLIEYTLAFAISNGVELVETDRGGFLQEGIAA